MQRIVDGILFEGNTVADAWEIRTWEANGVMERSIRPVIEFREVGEVPPLDDPEPLSPEEEAKREADCRRSSARRSKTMCRRIIITEAFDEMLTITYRENQEDRELCKRHFKEWVRRMRRALGGTFRYCASFEAQERGAMHVHVACHKLPVHATHRGVKVQGWRLGTEVWRSIVGADNGLVFVGGKSKFGAPRAQRRTLAQMASYVSKYIMKDAENVPVGANRYSRSNGEAPPKSEVIRVTQCSFADAIALAFECKDGDVLASFRVATRWENTMWLCTERGRVHPATKG